MIGRIHHVVNTRLWLIILKEVIWHSPASVVTKKPWETPDNVAALLNGLNAAGGVTKCVNWAIQNSQETPQQRSKWRLICPRLLTGVAKVRLTHGSTQSKLHTFCSYTNRVKGSQQFLQGKPPGQFVTYASTNPWSLSVVPERGLAQVYVIRQIALRWGANSLRTFQRR